MLGSAGAGSPETWVACRIQRRRGTLLAIESEHTAELLLGVHRWSRLAEHRCQTRRPADMHIV